MSAKIDDDFDLIDESTEKWAASYTHKASHAYHRAYQKDLREIKRLGLNMTVKQFRATMKGK